MNKKIKAIEVLNEMANNESYRPTVKYQEMTYTYRNDIGDYTNDFNSEYGIFSGWALNLMLNNEVEILEDNPEEIEELNAYKLMESPYMANLLKEQRYDKFMELLKQSEVEIADKLIKLTWVVKEMRKEIKCIELD